MKGYDFRMINREFNAVCSAWKLTFSAGLFATTERKLMGSRFYDLYEVAKCRKRRATLGNWLLGNPLRIYFSNCQIWSVIYDYYRQMNESSSSISITKSLRDESKFQTLFLIRISHWKLYGMFISIRFSWISKSSINITF